MTILESFLFTMLGVIFLCTLALFIFLLAFFLNNLNTYYGYPGLILTSIIAMTLMAFVGSNMPPE